MPDICSTCTPSKLHINGEIAAAYYSRQAASQPRTWEGKETLVVSQKRQFLLMELCIYRQGEFMQQWTKRFNATWVPSCAGWATSIHSQGIPEKLKQTQWLCLSWQLEATQGGEHTPMVWKRKIWGPIRHIKCTTLTCCSSSEMAHILKSTGTELSFCILSHYSHYL